MTTKPQSYALIYQHCFNGDSMVVRAEVEDLSISWDNLQSNAFTDRWNMRPPSTTVTLKLSPRHTICCGQTIGRWTRLMLWLKAFPLTRHDI